MNEVEVTLGFSEKVKWCRSKGVIGMVFEVGGQYRRNM
jgi:hypothetical protein